MKDSKMPELVFFVIIVCYISGRESEERNEESEFKGIFGD